MNGVIDQHGGEIWMSVFIAACLFVLSKLLRGIAPALYRRFFGRPRTMTEYADEVEEAACESVRADLYAAQCRAALVEKIGMIPKDFDPTVLFGCQIAAGVQRAAIAEAEQQGVIRAGTYRRTYGRSIEEEDRDGFREIDRRRGEEFDVDVGGATPITSALRRRAPHRASPPRAYDPESDSVMVVADPFESSPPPSRRGGRSSEGGGVSSLGTRWVDGRLVPRGARAERTGS